MTGYVGNVELQTANNNNFRTVIYTGKHSQLVLMSLLVGEEIGLETHGDVDQFFRLEVGRLKIIMNGEENILEAGMAAIVPCGVSHNVINIGDNVAKLYTLYTPPNHPEGTVHKTKAEAMEAE